jgi:hypothetical protein
MFKSLIYKEWLKTRWFLAGFLLLGWITLGLIFLKVQHDFKFYEAKNYWNSILFQVLHYFSSFKIIPLMGGLLVGISQYFPETVEKRIKLTFHLPVDEDKIILQMMSYGTLALTAIYMTLLVTFLLLSSAFFPQEIVISSLISIVPWLLSGYAVYFLIGLIVLEPIWKYRVLYTISSSFYITLYLKTAITGAYAPINILLSIATIVLSISLLFSGYRFRKGEQ